MISIESFRKLALSFPSSSEEPHFEKTSFRVSKKIFATLDLQTRHACLKLTEIQQSVYCAFDKSIIFPVPNKWGRQGWTLVSLDKVPKKMLAGAVADAYYGVAPASAPGATSRKQS